MRPNPSVRTRNISSHYNYDYTPGTRTFDYNKPNFNTGKNYHDSYSKKEEESKHKSSRNETSQGMASALNYNTGTKYSTIARDSILKQNSNSLLKPSESEVYVGYRASGKVEKPGLNLQSFGKETRYTSHHYNEEVKDDQSGFAKYKTSSPFSGLKNIGNTCFMYTFKSDNKELHSPGPFPFPSSSKSLS